MTITAKGVNGTVTFNGRFVEISRTGFMARTSVGKGTKRIPIHSITAVQWKPPGALVNGYIEFTVPGGREVRSQFGTATAGAGQNENAVVVTSRQAGAFLALRDAVEEALVGGQTDSRPATGLPLAPRYAAPATSSATPPPPPPPSVPAGWYSDSSDAVLLRYWDGGQWTEHTAPRPPQ